jgi:hypothetical protein
MVRLTVGCAGMYLRLQRDPQELCLNRLVLHQLISRRVSLVNERLGTESIVVPLYRMSTNNPNPIW